MCGNKVHQDINGLLRVVFQNAHDPIFECVGIHALDIVDDGFPERVVHNAVQLVAEQISPLYAIAFLVGGIFPDFADDNFFFAILLDALSQSIEEAVRQFVCNVQTITSCPEGNPVIQNTAIAADIIQIIRIGFNDIRQGINAPPCFILVVAEERIPAIIRAIGGLPSTDGIISTELVEINAVCTGVRENAVQDDGNAVLFRIFAEQPEIFVCTEKRVNISIVGSIIAVVFVGFKNRVQINAGNTQLFEVVELAADSLQIAAEIVIVPNVSVCIRLVVRCAIPVVPQYPVSRNIFMRLSALAESVRENLIHDTALEEVRRFIVLCKNGQLIQFAVVESCFVSSATFDIMSNTIAGIGKIIVMHTGIFWTVSDGIALAAVLFAVGIHRQKAFLKASAE